MVDRGQASSGSVCKDGRKLRTLVLADRNPA